MYQPDSWSFLASSSMTVSDLSSGYHSLPKSSLFVPDTPAFCAKIHGNSSNDWLRISSTGIAPLRGSPEAALTCCGIFISIRNIFWKFFAYTTLWPDRSIIIPVVCHRPASSNLTVRIKSCSLHEWNKSDGNRFFSLCVGFRCLSLIHIMADRFI